MPPNANSWQFWVGWSIVRWWLKLFWPSLRGSLLFHNVLWYYLFLFLLCTKATIASVIITFSVSWETRTAFHINTNVRNTTLLKGKSNVNMKWFFYILAEKFFYHVLSLKQSLIFLLHPFWKKWLRRNWSQDDSNSHYMLTSK